MKKSKLKLDEYEKEILADFEAGKLKSVLNPARKKFIKRVSEHSVKKERSSGLHD